MDYDTFLSSQRWAILEIIAQNPSSPLEISQQIGTSVSYVSQQLKLLEAAGLVIKVRTGSVDKGKPRLVYSIGREILHLTGLFKGYPIKKHVSLDAHKKLILRIWSLENEGLHYPLERLCSKIEDELDEVEGIFFDLSKEEVLIVSESKSVKQKVEKASGLKTRFVSENEAKKNQNLHAIYNQILSKGRQFVKGGDGK